MNRDVFSELMDGLDALAEERQNKVMLRCYKAEIASLPLVGLVSLENHVNNE